MSTLHHNWLVQVIRCRRSWVIRTLSKGTASRPEPQSGFDFDFNFESFIRAGKEASGSIHHCTWYTKHIVSMNDWMSYPRGACPEIERAPIPGLPLNFCKTLFSESVLCASIPQSIQWIRIKTISSLPFSKVYCPQRTKWSCPAVFAMSSGSRQVILHWRNEEVLGFKAPLRLWTSFQSQETSAQGACPISTLWGPAACHVPHLWASRFLTFYLCSSAHILNLWLGVSPKLWSILSYYAPAPFPLSLPFETLIRHIWDLFTLSSMAFNFFYTFHLFIS